MKMNMLLFGGIILAAIAIGVVIERYGRTCPACKRRKKMIMDALSGGVASPEQAPGTYGVVPIAPPAQSPGTYGEATGFVSVAPVNLMVEPVVLAK